MMIKKDVVFRLGKLEVFSMESVNEYYSPFVLYYWKDIGSSQSYGPFNTVNETVKHHEYLLAEVQHSKDNPTEATVIRADFGSKRRLDP